MQQNFRAVALVWLALFFGAWGATTVPAQASAPVRLIAVGDAGTGGAGQIAVGQAITQVCAARGCDFAVYLGDNIYESGVRGAYDAQFESKFELPYRDLNLPVYATLGNHDNSIAGGEGAQNAVGDFEVEYHFRRDRLTTQWRMPARYYSVRFGDVEIFSLDTNAILTLGAGTLDPNSLNQQSWLQNALARSTARWKLTFGHHPYISNGEHGNAGTYDNVPTYGAQVKTFMEQTFCNKADVYLCGHDHDIQMLRPVAGCGNTHFIVSGAGAKQRALADQNRNPAFFQRGNGYGFYWLEITNNTLRAVIYDENAQVLYDQTFNKPIN